MSKIIISYITPVLIEDLGMMYPTNTSKHKARFGIYKCQCGNEFKTQTSHINTGNTKSCGCHNISSIKKRTTTHSLSKHKLYKIHQNIINRTTKENHPKFKDYGGRGVIMSSEWRNDFMSFYNWAMDNGYENGLELDRRNNDGNYEPSNCRFVTRATQTRNTRVLRADNTSGYRGVCWHKQHNKWGAQICINKKIKHLGYYKTAIEAAKIYDYFVVDNNLEHTINGVL